MRELQEIITAADALFQEGKSAAVATVVAIEGSAYRRPGARLLVAEDGRSWGGVSGGCLERDVIRRGREVITTGRAQLHRYDTDEDSADASSTGCGGSIDIFIQAVDHNSRGPLDAIRDAIVHRRAAVIATLIRATGSKIPGDMIAPGKITGGRSMTNYLPEGGDCSPAWVDSTYGMVQQHIIDGEPCDLFIERVLPPQRLIIVGAGPDARAVATLAKTLGWHVTVVASRPAIGVYDRFATLADEVIVTGQDEPLAEVVLSADAAVVLMTHNIARDGAALGTILRLPHQLAYLGVLGPRHRTQAILDVLAVPAFDALASPTGLDIGAESPEELALSIIAEIQMVLRGATGRPLSRTDRPIHSSTRPATAVHFIRP